MFALRDDPLLLLLVVAPVLMVATELGYRLGQKFRGEDEKLHEQFVTTRDQVGLLLSLLLGFTLALATSRYDLRWHQAVEESDAVGTASRRLDLLPEPMRPEARRMFDEYIDTRLEFSNARDEAAMQRAHEKSLKVEGRIWAQAAAAAEQKPTPIMASYIASVTDAIDACDRRVAGLENRIPRTIWIMLGVLALVASITAGLSMRKRALAAMIPPIVFAIVTLLIADLDAPGKGLIQTDQRAIARMRE